MQIFTCPRGRQNTLLCNSRSSTGEIISATVNWIFPFVMKVTVEHLRMVDVPAEQSTACALNLPDVLHVPLQWDLKFQEQSLVCSHHEPALRGWRFLQYNRWKLSFWEKLRENTQDCYDFLWTSVLHNSNKTIFCQEAWAVHARCCCWKTLQCRAW